MAIGGTGRHVRRFDIVLVAGISLLALGRLAHAEPFDPTVTIGVLTNLSQFSDPTGTGSIEAAKMAVEDFRTSHPDTKIKPVVISADIQNKADIGITVARQWLSEQHVDLIVDVPNSAAALAVSGIAHAANRVMITTSSGSTRITGDLCSPTTLQWAINSYALSNAITHALIAEGKKSWFFITADYAFGRDLEQQATASITAAGGHVVGHALHPYVAADFASALLQAQASGAQVIGLANAVDDFSNTIKQAAEFHVFPAQTMAGFLVTITDIHAIGLPLAQHLRLVTPFYWDANDATRAWTKRFLVHHASYPTFMQASTYSATLHFLKSIDQAQTHDGDKIVATMRALPPQDDVYGAGTLRRDGLYVHALTMYEVKSPAESKGPWDYYRKLSEVSADDAFPPLAASSCPAITAAK